MEQEKNQKAPEQKEEKRLLSEELMIPAQLVQITELLDNLPRIFQNQIDAFQLISSTKMGMKPKTGSIDVFNSSESHFWKYSIVFSFIDHKDQDIEVNADTVSVLEQKFITALFKHEKFIELCGGYVERNIPVTKKKIKLETPHFKFFEDQKQE